MPWQRVQYFRQKTVGKETDPYPTLDVVKIAEPVRISNLDNNETMFKYSNVLEKKQAMLGPTEQDRAKVDQLYAIEHAISIFEHFVEGVPTRNIDGTAKDANMAEAHFLYFKQMEWIELFRGKGYTTDVGKTTLSYLKMKHVKVNQT